MAIPAVEYYIIEGKKFEKVLLGCTTSTLKLFKSLYLYCGLIQYHICFIFAVAAEHAMMSVYPPAPAASPVVPRARRTVRVVAISPTSDVPADIFESVKRRTGADELVFIRHYVNAASKTVLVMGARGKANLMAMKRLVQHVRPHCDTEVAIKWYEDAERDGDLRVAGGARRAGEDAVVPRALFAKYHDFVRGHSTEAHPRKLHELYPAEFNERIIKYIVNNYDNLFNLYMLGTVMLK